MKMTLQFSQFLGELGGFRDQQWNVLAKMLKCVDSCS